MNKPLLVFQGPIACRAGYGDHSRDLLKSLFEIDKYNVKIIPTQWGTTPQNQINPQTEFGKRTIASIITKLDVQPDIFIQVTVANEFKPIGKYNIGITAGVETTVVPREFIEGCNKMDLILTPSTFTKNVLLKTAYNQVDKRTNTIVNVLKIQKPILTLFEGVDLTVYNGKSIDSTFLDSSEVVPFCYLFVGHWLPGRLGEDRKDVGMLIKTFCTVFKNTPSEKQPGLILKTSSAGFSIIDREVIVKKIKDVRNSIGKKCPPIYLLFGDLKESELNELYNHPKVKSMVSFTKGEGYGRPLAEFATTGKPIIVSEWSGQLDFLPKDNTVYLKGKETPVHESAQNKFILKESKWFTVDYSMAAQQIFKVYNKYKQYLLESNGLQTNIRSNFSLKKMTEKFAEILDKNIPKVEHIALELPTIKKL